MIFNIVDCHKDILEYNKIELPFVLDGVTNCFIFSNGTKRNEFVAFNIWTFKENYSKAPKAKIVLSAFDKIANLLIQNGIDEKYFKLE